VALKVTFPGALTKPSEPAVRLAVAVEALATETLPSSAPQVSPQSATARLMLLIRPRMS
jgi:hypothetical protein